MNERIVKQREIAGRQMSLETGFLAEQAHGAVLARYGDTVVLATVVAAAPRDDIDYFPLSVEYEERLYAGGIIKGSRWVKREGRPTDQAILNARVIDRSIRPLFSKDYKQDVQVIATVLSVDDENDPVVLSLIAVSAAIKASGIPWGGPVVASRIGSFNGEFVVNPSTKSMPESDMDLIVSATKDNVLMVEMGANQIPEDKVLEAIQLGYDVSHDAHALIEEFVDEVVAKIGYKYVNKTVEVTPEMQKEQEALTEVKSFVMENYPAVLLDSTSEERHEVQAQFLTDLFAKFEGRTTKNKMNEVFEKVAKHKMRKKIIETGERVDGRKVTEIRPISSEVGLLPRVHGSAVFTRGSTQAVTVTTLGPTSLAQLIEGLHGEETKRYMHHYNFPPYSTGETGRVGSPKRREIGHGALAERALEPVIPAESDFPYAIRVVSEAISSNGSTSMASVCGSTLSLMDAGVPIKKPVSGIAMGLIKEGDDVVVLSDIMGVEDFYGDMDFKVAGTEDGITALQMDVKIAGLPMQVFETALAQAKVGRMHILGKMLEAIQTPRESLSHFAPKIETLKINPKKIGELIGPGGKVIRGLQESTGTEISVEEDGTVFISGVDPEALARAVEQVDMITKEVEIGQIYHGRVTRLMDFGAFVQVLPGQEGLVHISELAPGFVKNIRDEVSEGEEMDVKVIEIDSQGRINLSRKAVLADEEKQRQGKQDS